MAVITSASSGNFSNSATWVGGVVPGINDDAVAATGHIVTIDTDITVISLQQAGTGKFQVGNGRTVNANVIANAGTFTSGGTLEVTATTSTTINGNLSGISTTASNVAGIVVSGIGTLTFNGNISISAGNATSEALGNSSLYINSNATVIVNGSIDLSGAAIAFKRAIHLSSNASTASLTVNAGSASIRANAGAGSYAIWAVGTSNQITVNCGLLRSYGGGATSAPTILVDGSSATLTVNASSIEGGSGGQNVHAIRFNSASGVANITSPVINAGGGGFAISIQGNASTTTINATTIIATATVISAIGTGPTVNINSSLIQGSATQAVHAISTTGTNAILNVTATTIIGGSFGSSFAIYQSGTGSTLSVIGPSFAVNSLNHAIGSDATSNGVIYQGNMTDAVDGSVAVWCRVFRLTSTPAGVTKYASGPNYPFGTLVSRVEATNSAGMPATSNVRSGTVYGDTSQFTGTVAVPSASQVTYGVPVDATTGVGLLDLDRVADIVEMQVSAGAYERTAV